MKKINLELKIDEKIFNDFYLPYLFEYKHKIEVNKGSAGSGKSYAVTQKVIIKSLSMPNRKVLFIRKVGATLRDSVWQLTLDILEQFRLLDKCTVNKSEFRITLPNKSVFLFKGLDDSEKIKSITGITDIVIEEASELNIDDFTQLQLRLRANVKNCQTFLMFNPVSKLNWTYSTFKFTEENQCDPIREYGEIIVFCTTYKDNKFLSADYIKTLEDMKETNYQYYMIYVLGRFVNQGKCVYNNWIVEYLDIQELLKQNLELCCGIDTGFNHPYAICISLVDKEKKLIYVINQMYKREITNEDAYKWICKHGYGGNNFICDSASPRDIEELKRLGLKVKGCKKGKSSVFNGITRIQNYKIIVDENCTDFINEISSYNWQKDKNGNYTDEPVTTGDDLMDSFRYSLENVIGKKKPKLINIRL